MAFFWIIVIIIVVWKLSRSSQIIENSSPQDLGKKEDQELIITEEQVFKSQDYFDTKLQEEIDFPDAIRGYSIYVYKNLMRVWYKELSGKNRYNDQMTQRLRSDWLDYMSSIEDGATCGYLFMEISEEDEPEKVKNYRHRAYAARQKTNAIEDGFAALMGNAFVEKLKEVRFIKEKNYSKFDKFGNLAPEGFEYDFRGEIRKEK